MNNGRGQALAIIILAVLALAGWFWLHAWPLGASLLGGVAGFALAGVFLPSLTRLPSRFLVGIAGGYALFGFLLVYMTRSELGYIDLGSDIAPRVHGVAHAVAGLFGGIAVRCLIKALPRG